MTEILYNIDEKPNWERMVKILKQFDEREQERIYGYIQGRQGAWLDKKMGKERENEAQ